MKRKSVIGIVFLLVIVFMLFVQASTPMEITANEEHINYKDTLLFTRSNYSYEITKVIDLQGKKASIPEGCVLSFKGGRIINGAIEGNNTSINGKKDLFDNVKILGSWNVPIISTNMFVSLSEDNALKDVFALANPEVDNKIIIEKGQYWVKATEKEPNVLNVCSNSIVEVNGLILLRPNDLRGYAIINVSKGENIVIKGSGELKGDKHEHTGKSGQWGMCLKLTYANNVNVSNLRLTNAWGDCIYIGRGCKKVCIEDCTLDEGRRQGISVIAGTDVVIKRCTITNVKGTAPQHAIDIEPNKNDVVERVYVEGVTVKNCIGGLMVYGRKKGDTQIRDVTFKNCYVECGYRAPIRFVRCDKGTAIDCKVVNGGKKAGIVCVGVKEIKLKKNKVHSGLAPYSFEDCGKIDI